MNFKSLTFIIDFHRKHIIYIDNWNDLHTFLDLLPLKTSQESAILAVDSDPLGAHLLGAVDIWCQPKIGGSRPPLPPPCKQNQKFTYPPLPLIINLYLDELKFIKLNWIAGRKWAFGNILNKYKEIKWRRKKYIWNKMRVKYVIFREYLLKFCQFCMFIQT